MKAWSRCLLGLFALVQFVAGLPAESRSEISINVGTNVRPPPKTSDTSTPSSRSASVSGADTTGQDLQGNGLPTRVVCGQTITEDTTLDEDLTCPPDTSAAIVIGASNITLDLGEHVLRGHTPGTGVFALGQEGIIIRNGTVEGFNDGVFIIESRRVTVENLTVKNHNVIDPEHQIYGIHIDHSQDVVVRDMLFEFPSVPHKDSVTLYASDVTVSNIEVRGGGVGVNFSWAQVCDPAHAPNNGTILNSRFSENYTAGIWLECSSSSLITGNDFTPTPGHGTGIQGHAPFFGAVTGLTVQGNFIHEGLVGISFRGIISSSISNNVVSDNSGCGIAMEPSEGCLTSEPGAECFYSTANVITDNETWGNGTDLYHHEDSRGNIWEGNTCETKQGADIPECTPPAAILTINYVSGKPGSFFTLTGANFPTNSTATTTVNDNTLGTVPTDSSGDLVFLLNTDQADEGNYIVTATVNPSASARFVLDSSEPIRPQEGNGTIFNVPSGIAYTTHIVYLPFVRK